ncbi:unnamed protein product, partial [Prunus brigantina]
VVAFGTQPTDSSIRATSFSRTHGKPTIDLYSPTSKFYTTCTPPKVYKGSTIPQNGDLTPYRGPRHIEGEDITKLSRKVPNHFSASIVWRLDEIQQQTIQTTQSSQSPQTPSRQRKGKKGAKATPASSKQLVVPAPRDQPHILKKVYTDCRHQINDKEAERLRSPIRVNAPLRDSRLKVLGDKSPIRKVQGLQVRAGLPRTMVSRRFQAGTPLSAYFFGGFRRWKMTGPGPKSLTRESFGQDPLPSASRGLSNEGQCLLFPSSLTEATLNWFYRLELEW